MQSTNSQSLLDEAWALVENNRLRDARKVFERVCELDETEAEAWMMRGSIHGDLGETEPAIACLERAIAIDPCYADALLHLGKIRLNQGQLDQALQDCRKAAQCDPAFVEAWLLLSAVQAQSGSWVDAEQSCRQALVHNPGEPRAVQQLARITQVVMRQSDLGSLEKTPPIFVLGIPRSGTSMIAGALHHCGAWIGETVPGGPSNPEGFFENVMLRERVLKPMLSHQGADLLDVRAMPELDRLTPQSGLKDQVLRQLSIEQYPGGDQAWLYKDGKLSLVWPLWRDAFPNARWVIVRRPADDIVRSCLHTNFMSQHSFDPQFWRAWVRQYEQRLEALKASGVWWREIDSHDTVSDLSTLRTLVQDLGLQWNEPAVRSFIKPQHWHALSNDPEKGGKGLSPTHSEAKPSGNRILLNSVAKAGTHLLTRTVALLQCEPFPFFLHGAHTKQRPIEAEETEDSVLVGVIWPCLVNAEGLTSILGDVPRNQYLKAHLPYSPRTAKILEDLDYKMVIIVRDPRDVALSHINWSLTRDYLPHQKYYESLSPDERLSQEIEGFAFLPDGPVVLDLRKRYEYILKWRGHPMVYVTSFERLVGPSGGGSAEAQREEIDNIAAHLGIELTDDHRKAVIDNLFGGTVTFKKGKSGGWKQHFSEKHKQKIKALMGDLIIELGYERNNDW
ncbi:MAG: tetratricopeptide repeat protein [Thiobacillus sp.]|uniref:tetratricopeptide repeat protein n=1 Tax=Thiobacillus sp. TaxID=924 RepID=UPI002735BCBC|nr:tetratricopeptide repeat protein [Thiobacillus sp.]MDP3584460.1 tetratricopeptide repeat protein [Thiobacillus sp.]